MTERAELAELVSRLVALSQEYRAECEGLGMTQTVAEIDKVLARVEPLCAFCRAGSH